MNHSISIPGRHRASLPALRPAVAARLTAGGLVACTLAVLLLAAACGHGESTTTSVPPTTMAVPAATHTSPPPASTPTTVPTGTPTSQPPANDGPAEAPPSASQGDTWIRPTDGMVMVYVPGGTFQMGSSDAQIEAVMALCDRYPDEYGKCKLDAFESESPQHAVTLEGFWIDRTEVTNAQYARCVADGACRASRLAGQAAYGGDDLPVAGVPWQDAANYCDWAGGRLPTEAEWEYAARGSEGRIYPWGDKFDCAGGNFWDSVTGCDDGYPEPAPVGSFPGGASWCSALDMAGNAWEWVGDLYEAYSPDAQRNPTGPDSGSQRILRGGSWGYTPAFVRTATRYPVPPAADYLAVGFRCAIPADRVTSLAFSPDSMR